MKFETNQINALLSLPCVINDEKSLIETAIFATAEKEHEHVFAHQILPNESVGDFLRRIYQSEGPYEMDCSTFGQLASYVLGGTWPGSTSNGGPIIIAIGAPGVGDVMLWSDKIPEMGYISVTGQENSAILTKIPCASKGQWCIQVDDDKFLGLSRDGPRLISFGEWIARLRDGLVAFADVDSFNMRSSDFYMLASRNLIACLLDDGQLNEWGFFTQKRDPDLTGTWSENDVKITVRNRMGLPGDDINDRLLFMMREIVSICSINREREQLPHSDLQSLYPTSMRSWDLPLNADFDGDEIIPSRSSAQGASRSIISHVMGSRVRIQHDPINDLFLESSVPRPTIEKHRNDTHTKIIPKRQIRPRNKQRASNFYM